MFLATGNYRLIQNYCNCLVHFRICEGIRWRTRRRMLTPAFHFQILESFFDVFNEQSRSLIDELTAILSAKKMNDTVDVYDIMTQCALDIICGKCFIMRSVHSTVKLGIKLSVS